MAATTTSTAEMRQCCSQGPAAQGVLAGMQPLEERGRRLPEEAPAARLRLYRCYWPAHLPTFRSGPLVSE
jgi:hypothetical protein